MAGQDLEYYLEHPDEFEALSEDQQATVFNNGAIEGDTPPAPVAAEESSATPAAAEASPATPEPPAAEPSPVTPSSDAVVLAKDGKHTIPYEELLAARETARQWEQRARELEQRQAAPAAPAAPADATPPPSVEELFEQANNAMLDGDLAQAKALQAQALQLSQEQAVAAALAKVEEKLTQARQQEQQATAEQLLQAQAAKTVAAYPFLDSTSAEANPDAIELVIAQRDKLIAAGTAPHEALAQAAEKVAPLFQIKPALQPPPPPQSPTPAVQSAAAAAIAKAKAAVPASLSDVPAGSRAPHDELEALRDMTSTALDQKFSRMTADQILESLARVM